MDFLNGVEFLDGNVGEVLQGNARSGYVHDIGDFAVQNVEQGPVDLGQRAFPALDDVLGGVGQRGLHRGRQGATDVGNGGIGGAGLPLFTAFLERVADALEAVLGVGDDEEDFLFGQVLALMGEVDQPRPVGSVAFLFRQGRE